jgi:hypothetical protein
MDGALMPDTSSRVVRSVVVPSPRWPALESPPQLALVLHGDQSMPHPAFAVSRLCVEVGVEDANLGDLIDR